MLLNSDLKNSQRCWAQAKARVSRAARKHGFLGIEKTREGMIKERLSSAVICLAGVGQMMSYADPPRVHEQTHSHVLTHTNKCSSQRTCHGRVGIHEDGLMSSHQDTQTHQTRYCICVVVNDSVLPVWFPASDPITINDSICVWAVVYK